MERISGEYAEDRRFRNGDVANRILPTRLNAQWLNHVQEEICNAITASGRDLDGDNSQQLSQSISDFCQKGVGYAEYPIENIEAQEIVIPILKFDSEHVKAAKFTIHVDCVTSTDEENEFWEFTIIYSRQKKIWLVHSSCIPRSNERITFPSEMNEQFNYSRNEILPGENYSGFLRVSHIRYFAQ